MSSTTSPAIAVAVYNALRPARVAGLDWPTVAQERVYYPRDWPIEEIDIPILKIGVPTEQKVGLGKSGIQFETTCSLTVYGEVSANGESDDQAANKVMTALGMFQREIELTVIGDPVLFGGAQPGLIENLQAVTTKYETTAKGSKARGAFAMTFEFNFYQGTEDFRQPPTYDIARFHIYADLINVADPSGTYTPPLDYTPTPAPRTEGPEGRIEFEAEVEIPTS